MQTNPLNFGGNSAPIPPVVKALLIANGVGYLLTSLFPALNSSLALYPGKFFMPWQLISYGFLHASPEHLFFNMFGLWMFGSQLERLWGSRPFALYYFVCMIGAGVIQLVIGSGPTVGASGGVFGLLLGFGMMYPNRIIMLIIPPVPMKAKYFVIIYGAIELWLGLTASRPTIAHFAHLGGMLFGFIMIHYWRGNLPIKPQRQLNR